MLNILISLDMSHFFIFLFFLFFFNMFFIKEKIGEKRLQDF